MEANTFISKLKSASNNGADILNWTEEYKTILCDLATKDRGQFALNVLNILCRNLEKLPSFQDNINNEALLRLSIECVRETRTMAAPEQVRVLAAVYHLHRHVVRQNKYIPPELVLKISMMPFEVDSKYLLKEYYKTYWGIIADRILYIERLKLKVDITKALPRLNEDISKVINIYDPMEFCLKNLVYLIKKLHLLYSDNPKELNQTYVEIFTELSARETTTKLTENHNIEIYVKLNQCLFKVVKNASKMDFKGSSLDVVLKSCISLIAHSPEFFHCLQTFYMGTFYHILTETKNSTYVEKLLETLPASFETTEKMYKKAMYITYPYLQQLLRLFIEHKVSNPSKWNVNFNIKVQEQCLKLTLFFMTRSKKLEQISICGKCQVKSGLHDTLRLSLLTKHFVTVSLAQKMLITDILPVFYDILNKQFAIIEDLNTLNCANSQQMFCYLEKDVHSTAISLNTSQYYTYALKLFDIYLMNELKCASIDHKNITRALYNKSISELECQLYENALINAFLSVMFNQDQNSEKYMGLVITIKAKVLESKADDDGKNDELQLISIYEGCRIAVQKKLYYNLEKFASKLDFRALLEHEFTMYCNIWPSMAPIAGVWRSLHLLATDNHGMDTASKQAFSTLCEVILATPVVVRTIHSDHFSNVVDSLLLYMDSMTLSVDLKLVYASLLYLRFEYDMADASQKYRWKNYDPLQSGNPDRVPTNRTIPQEHAATTRAIQVVQLLTDLLPQLSQASRVYLQRCLHLVGTLAPQLLHLYRDLQGYQLAHVCCHMARILDDHDSYLLNAGMLIAAAPASPSIDRIISTAARYCGRSQSRSMVEVIFICDVAMYYTRCGDLGKAARLVRSAEATVLSKQGQTDDYLELAVGRLLEAQSVLCDTPRAPSRLSAVNLPHRHYLAISQPGELRWSSRRFRSTTGRHRLRAATLRALRPACGALLWRRARRAAAASLPDGTAPHHADLYTCFLHTGDEEAQIAIDNRLKYYLGLHPSNELQPYLTEPKHHQFTPKLELEPMRDDVYKTRTSPTLCLTTPAFKKPEFFNHSNCTCYACDIPMCLNLSCKTSALEAAVYSNCGEIEIARNYFKGAQDMFEDAERKLKNIPEKHKNFEDYVVKIVTENYDRDLKEAKVQMLIDLSLFELRNKNFDAADEHLISIHETVQEVKNLDEYTKNDILNLTVASARLKNNRKIDNYTLEAEFDNLKLSPVKEFPPAKTPESKPTKPPVIPKILVNNEKLPKKRTKATIKLNYDDNDKKEFEKPTRVTRGKKIESKVPITKHTLELATPKPCKIFAETPKPIKSVPEAVLDEFATPAQNDTQMFTPEHTPEQFFTPLTSVKTYTKKTLHQNIVKNLEEEFLEAKCKENLTIDKNALKSVEKECLIPKSKEVISVDKTKELKGAKSRDSNNRMKTDSKLPIQIKKDSLKLAQAIKDKTDTVRPRRDKTAILQPPQTKKADRLKRATSPGKLATESKENDKQRRLRRHVKLSLDEDSK